MKITIVGCGVMGQGLARRLSSLHTIFLCDRHQEKAVQLEREGHGIACLNPTQAFQESDIVILAVKPQSLKETALSFEQIAPPHQLLISLLSGTLLEELKKTFSHTKIIRLMPNLALIYGKGLIGLVSDQMLDAHDKRNVEQICENLGKFYWIEEEQMNAFTALAGSGPAFIFAMVESMIEAGIGMGFNSMMSSEIVQQMIAGSLHLLEKSAEHPSVLKWKICSPKGTTIAGLKRFEELAVRAGIINTFYAACERAEELSNLVEE